MKSILMTMVFFASIFSLSAQSDNDRMERKELKKEFYQNLSEDQKKKLDHKKQLHKGHKSAMEATFTEKQLAIVNDKSLSKRERRKALIPTMSDEQQTMAKNHKETMKLVKEEFKNTLSEEQLEEYESFRKNRKKRDNAH